jgi:protein-S-isoprenylcysteine O-methyltransferase Ste14
MTPTALKALAFVAISAALVYVSRAALRAPRSHGFYRFFAWECIVALFLLNMGAWFQSPLSWHQLVSWLMLFASIVLLTFGFRSLASHGRPVPQRAAEPGLLAFEKTSALVTDGIYRYIRHPLYSSLLFLTWGIFFKALTWPGLFLTLAATLLLAATAKADEAECLRFFGPAYRAYIGRTKRFVPFVW